MRVWPLLSLLALFSLQPGCEGASAQSGTASFLRIQGAQYVPGELDPSDRQAAPEVHRIDSQNNSVYRGIAGKSVGGSVGPGSTAVLIGLQGDSGHWILPVQSFDQSSPGDLVFSGKASLSPLTPLGPVDVIYRAVNAAGDIGPISSQQWKVTDTAVSGQLIISLDWDSEADLDLRVTAPDATGKEVEIWSRKTSAAVKPGPGELPSTEEDLASVGRLDFDSNSQCVLDGRQQENVYWVTKPARANQLYTVRVDAFSMCGETLAHWRVRVLLDDAEVLSARGQMGDSDTRFDHGPGAGLQVLQFTY
jgi:hypothetical protein